MRPEQSTPRLISAALALSLVSAACSGGSTTDPVPEAAEPAPTTALVATTVPAPVETTTVAPAREEIVEDTPETLAFASSQDLGRLYELDGSAGDVFVASEAAGDQDLGPIDPSIVVRALSAKNRGGVLWVRIEDAEQRLGLGWVQSEQLRTTDAWIERDDPDAVRQFIRVVNVRSSSFLNVRSAPSGDADAVARLGPNETFMHGGAGAITGDGSTWVDAIDAETGNRIGWVSADFVTVADGIHAQTSEGIDVSELPNRDLAYGASIDDALVTATGCNASQITVTAASGAAGLHLLFGTQPSAPSDGSTWSFASGGDLWVDPGATVVLTVPTAAADRWYLLAVDEDGAAIAQQGPTGLTTIPSTIDDLLSFDVQSSFCGVAPPVPTTDPQSTAGVDDEFAGLDPDSATFADLADSGIDVEELRRQLDEEANGSADPDASPAPTDEGATEAAASDE